MFIPHITVWGSSFSLCTRCSSVFRPPSSRLRTHISPHLTALTSNHSSHTPLILHHSSHNTPLISCLSSHSTHRTPLISQHSSNSTQLTFVWLVFVWQAQYTQPSGGAAARVVAAWPAAGFRVAGAVHTAFWRSCCARARRLARGWLSCGRRSTHSLLEELLRAWSLPGRRLAFVWQVQYTGPAGEAAAWSPPGPRLPFVWQAQYTGPAGEAAARVVAAWPAAAVRVARAVHRACWRSCSASGRSRKRKSGDREGWHDCIPRIPSCSQCDPLDSVHIRFWDSDLLHHWRIWRLRTKGKEPFEWRRRGCISQKLSFLARAVWLATPDLLWLRQCRSWAAFSRWHLTNDCWFIIMPAGGKPRQRFGRFSKHTNFTCTSNVTSLGLGGWGC